MSRYTASLLQKLKKENDSFIKKHDKLIKEKGDWVFINTECHKEGNSAIGMPFDRSTPNKKLKKLLKRYELPKHTMHSFRRTAGTYIAIETYDYEAAQHLLGHKSLQTTIESYVRSTESINREYVDQINNIIGTKEETQENNEDDNISLERHGEPF